ncbi:MAG: hypothetical protein LBR18_04705 [Tannerella sp.]|jgi:hypothetical protein|nr:hypothetical protein [Tannerella sp.]
MATITLEYNSRSITAQRIIEIILSMKNLFKVKDNAAMEHNIDVTMQAIRDAENGDVVTCDSYEDYLKQTAEYV